MTVPENGEASAAHASALKEDAMHLGSAALAEAGSQAVEDEEPLLDGSARLAASDGKEEGDEEEEDEEEEDEEASGVGLRSNMEGIPRVINNKVEARAALDYLEGNKEAWSKDILVHILPFCPLIPGLNDHGHLNYAPLQKMVCELAAQPSLRLEQLGGLCLVAILAGPRVLEVVVRYNGSKLKADPTWLTVNLSDALQNNGFSQLEAAWLLENLSEYDEQAVLVMREVRRVKLLYLTPIMDFQRSVRLEKQHVPSFVGTVNCWHFDEGQTRLWQLWHTRGGARVSFDDLLHINRQLASMHEA